jgi:hypothetical protein
MITGWKPMLLEQLVKEELIPVANAGNGASEAGEGKSSGNWVLLVRLADPRLNRKNQSVFAVLYRMIAQGVDEQRPRKS